jgi:uncharacterized OB-fold protein
MTQVNERQQVVALGLILPVSETDHVKLRGSKCPKCSEAFYPERDICQNCSNRELMPWEFGPYGSLYTFTIVRDPAALPPRPVGQAEFDGRVRVQAPILTTDLEALRPDIPIELALRKLGSSEDGRELVGFGFRLRHQD